ncbi:Methyl-accepting chemotaxis protein [Caenispirillum salinarum AK4]|uniref:Methyl-accepting chemotaxis protein n=1 Tax=Caenispirillum salinarum AK4 TaxID=1238182 RepID=K9GX56_9PROT|nr:methyl-accepting chemotaxis protein [Caenispirillum salinarum]EKV29832.1 Methyl-accepting chemotaxis protein [Caenispirillum salinarum AK4]
MTFLDNMKVAAKVSLGFGIVLVLLVVTGIVSGVGFNSVDGMFESYRHLARETNEVGRIQANMLETRMGAKDFLIDGSEAAMARVRERAETTLSLAEETRGLLKDTEQAKIQLLDEVQQALRNYRDGFEQIVSHQSDRNAAVMTLNTVGPQIEQALTSVMESAYEDGDTEAAYRGGVALRALLLARLNVNRFLVDNSDAAFDRVSSELAAFDQRLIELNNNTTDFERRKLTGTAETLSGEYREAFNTAAAAIRARNAVVDGTLNQIGPAVGRDVETVKLEIKAAQDDLGPRVEASIHDSVLLTVGLGAAALVLGIGAAFLIGRGISQPVTAMTGAMARLADGDETTEVPAQGRKDEVGKMAAAVQVFKDNMIRANKLAAEQEKEREAREQRARYIEDLAHRFDSDVSSVLEAVSSASTELSSTAESMSSIAEETTRQATAVAAAADQASTNVQTVASAAEELSSSISEIGRQVNHSAEISRSAAEQAQHTNEVVQGLAESAQRIGDVVAMITDIADQTNLLALNATIEAARAGDAGKGFAVVANEVKSLANQTSKATEDISKQIGGIQGETQKAVEAITTIGKTVNEISEVASAIASAVEEQNAATSEIARNTNEASAGTHDVSSNIAGVTSAADEAGHAATQVMEATGQLSQQSEQLRGVVQEFLTNVRAA